MYNSKIKGFLDEKDWKFFVKNSPIFAIDFVIQNEQNEILMGRRTNNPAKDYYFVPGGRVFKNEKIEKAIQRISKEELNLEIDKKDTQFINYFEHFYKNSLWNEESINTHYIVLAFQIIPKKNLDYDLSKQHKEFKWISEINSNKYNVHKYSFEYFKKINL